VAQQRTSGLFKRGAVWHIAKGFRGGRIRESTGTGDFTEAEAYLARKIEELRQAQVYGVRPKRTFRQAATKYLNEKEKRSLYKDAWSLKRIDPFIGSLTLENVHMGTLRPYIEHAKKQGLKHRTINMPLEVVRHILNLAAGEWLDEHGLTWLQSAPKIRLLPRTDAKEPYPLNGPEQAKLFAALPRHLRRMCLFAVNTGLRDGELCGLRWEYEIEIPEMEASVFIVPKEQTKNQQDRRVVLNRIAAQVIEECRGDHPEFVFVFRGHPVKSMYNTGWKEARAKVGLDHVRIHDLRHTFGRRLRAAGVSFEDRQDLLAHKSGRMTTHYSQAELGNLIAAANKICGESPHKVPTLVTLRKKIPLRLVANRAE